MPRRVKYVVVAAPLTLLCIYLLTAVYDVSFKRHSPKEGLAFSANPSAIGKKVTRLGASWADTYAEPLAKAWDRSEEWKRNPGTPVLRTGPTGSWDEGLATFASVIKDVNDFKMYYSGRTSNLEEGNIGLATSRDGKAFVKYHGNPVLRRGGPGSWDETIIWCPMVWKEESYHMIYSGRNSRKTMQIGYATSVDGIHWMKSARNPVFNDPTWAHDRTEGWGVIKIADSYLLWYNTLGIIPRQVGVAVSKDLIEWTPYKNIPIFASVDGSDRYHQFCAFPFRHRSYYYLIVPSQDKSRNWAAFYLYRCKTPYFDEKDRECVRRILLPARIGQWDDHDLDTPALLTLDCTRSTFYEDKLWLYYSGEGGDERWQEGLLIESDIGDGLRVPGGSEPD